MLEIPSVECGSFDQDIRGRVGGETKAWLLYPTHFNKGRGSVRIRTYLLCIKVPRGICHYAFLPFRFLPLNSK